MNKYYSINRPISLGCYPHPADNPVVALINFDDRQYIENIGREAWGYIIYKKPLTEKDVADYEFVERGCK